MGRGSEGTAVGTVMSSSSSCLSPSVQVKGNSGTFNTLKLQFVFNLPQLASSVPSRQSLSPSQTKVAGRQRFLSSH